MTRKVKGAGAKRKGSRAEIKWRNLLRRIYPQPLRHLVQRVPMSGAGWMKGDVYDSNDVDSCYEVKCQETLNVPEWWRQTVSQAGLVRTPVLAITQSYRPFYVIMRCGDWDAMWKASMYKDQVFESKAFANCANLFDRMDGLDGRGVITVDGEQLYVIQEDLYIKVKRDLYNSALDKTVYID